MDNDLVLGLQLGQDEIHRCQALPYEKYLLLPWWDYVRSRTLRRARGHCELCQSRAARQAHHTTYERIGCEKPDDMVALCQRCHQHVTSNGLGKLSRSDLLKRRSEIMHSPEFQRAESGWMRY